jgi:TonB family protein
MITQIISHFRLPLTSMCLFSLASLCEAQVSPESLKEVGPDSSTASKSDDIHGHRATDSIDEFIESDNPVIRNPEVPWPVSGPQPDYPKSAKAEHVKGQVVVRAEVDTLGNVANWEIVVVKPEGWGFEREVAKVISHWKFEPASQDGHPVSRSVYIPFNFRPPR